MFDTYLENGTHMRSSVINVSIVIICRKIRQVSRVGSASTPNARGTLGISIVPRLNVSRSYVRQPSDNLQTCVIIVTIERIKFSLV